MGLPRFHIDPEELKREELRIPARELAHLAARRIGPGDLVSLFDGRGGEAVGRVEERQRSQVLVRVVDRPEPFPPPGPEAVLGLGLCRWERLRLAVEKATELGAAAVRPLVTERSQPARPGLEAKLERVVIETLKQCRRSRGPSLAPPRGLAGFLKDQPSAGLKVILDRSGPPLAGLLEGKQGTVTLLVGPEGGFSPREQEEAREAGFRPAGLSPATLRTETAVLAGLTLVMALMNGTGNRFEEAGGPFPPAGRRN